MIWTPRKKLITSRYMQRGNIVFTTGLPPTEIVDPAGNYFPSGDPSPGGAWTVAQDWQVLSGQLVSIEAAFQAQGGRPRAGTLWWSPDGTKLTLNSSSADNSLCFECSTPFDPETASQIFNLFQTNPTWAEYNEEGTRYVEMGTTDTYRMRAANGFVITSSTILSDMSKTNVGFTSSTDAPAIWSPRLDYCLWIGGDGGGDAIKNISIPGLDLDSFVVEETYNHGSINPNGNAISNMDKTETMCYTGIGSQGVEIISFDAPRDIQSFLRSGAYDLRTNVPASFDFRPGQFWFDPNDTRYVWAVADPTSNFQMVKYDTHVPTDFED